MLGRPKGERNSFPDDRDLDQELEHLADMVMEEPKMVNDISTTPKDQNTFIAKGSEFVGKLTFEGTVRINGRIDGEIFSRGTLVIGPDADIKAKINVDSVVISGMVNGNIVAKKRIEMRAPARLKGNITTPSLIIEEGVQFEGNCKMDKESVNAGNQQAFPEPKGPGKEDLG